MGDDRDYGEPWEPEEFGVRSSAIGSFVPEGTYRPVPIVWLAGAGFLQIFALIFLFVLLFGRPPFYTLAATGLISFSIGRWTFRRGMAQAGRGWRVFTVAVLVLNWAIVSFGAFAMAYG